MFPGGGIDRGVSDEAIFYTKDMAEMLAHSRAQKERPGEAGRNAG